MTYRLVRMFSFSGDTVLDPFAGTGTTMVAALRAGRNSIGVEIDAECCRLAAHRLRDETAHLFSRARLLFEKTQMDQQGVVFVREEPEAYVTRRRPRTSPKAADEK